MISDLLTCSKKAASESEAQALLQRGLALKKAYGTPVHVIDLGRFAGEYQSPWKMAAQLNAHLQDELSVTYGILSASLFLNKLSTENLVPLCENIVDVLNKGHRATCKPFSDLPSHRTADHFSPSRYDAPYFALVLPLSESTGIKDVVSKRVGTCVDKLPDYPGWNAQYQLFALAHEMGHAAGAGERQTEMMSAIVCRQAFADTTFLRVWSDMRAVSALFRFDKEMAVMQYGWPMADVIDDVLNMPQERVDAMTEENVLSLRFRRFSLYSTKCSTDLVLERTGGAIRKAVFGDRILRGTFDLNVSGADLPMLADAANHVAGRTTDREQIRIARRFALAARRLWTGMPAYQPGANFQEPAYG